MISKNRKADDQLSGLLLLLGHSLQQNVGAAFVSGKELVKPQN